MITDGNACLERCDHIRIWVHHVEAADDSLPTWMILRQVLKHPVCNIQVRECPANVSELLVHDGKVLEILLNRASNVRMMVQELLGVVGGQPKVLHLESAEDGVPHQP